MLEINHLGAAYGEAVVLVDVTLKVPEGRITALLGPNGAGKTTLVKAVSKIIEPTAGSVVLDGQDLAQVPRHRVVATGLAVVPEGRRIFPMMSVEDNLLMGAYHPAARARVRETLEEVYDRFPRLRDRAQQRGGTLSGGEQQMLALGRGLMARPRYLLMDEPSLGLSPLLTTQMFELIASVTELGVGVLLVEQNVPRTLEIAEYGYVLEQGRIVQEGTSSELSSSERVRQAYLAL
jgi:branched-chain amino acid transport system ATP-binding protein